MAEFPGASRTPLHSQIAAVPSGLPLHVPRKPPSALQPGVPAAWLDSHLSAPRQLSAHRQTAAGRGLTPAAFRPRAGRSAPARAYPRKMRSPSFTTVSAMHRSHFLPSSDSDMFFTGNSSVPQGRPPRSPTDGKSRESRPPP